MIIGTAKVFKPDELGLQDAFMGVVGVEGGFGQ